MSQPRERMRFAEVRENVLSWFWLRFLGVGVLREVKVIEEAIGGDWRWQFWVGGLFQRAC